MLDGQSKMVDKYSGENVVIYLFLIVEIETVNVTMAFQNLNDEYDT